MTALLLQAHADWRYVVVFVTLLALAKFLMGWLGRATWSEWDRRIGVAMLAVYDIQVVLGVALWVMLSAWTMSSRQAWEHPLTMLLPVVAVHVTWLQIQQEPSASVRFRSGFTGFVVAAAIMGLGIWRITGR